ncbi:MAG: ATP-binding protein [Phycisphaerae bacterium]
MSSVHVVQGPDKGHTYATSDGLAIIGRNAGHISLTDHSASRRHAEIRRDNGSWVLRDLNSANGTFLNGQRVRSAVALKHGDRIRIGETVLTFGEEERHENLADSATLDGSPCLNLSEIGCGSSILASINASQERVILNPPQTEDAVAAWNVLYRVAELIGVTNPEAIFLERVADILFAHLAAESLVLLTCDSGRAEFEPKVVRRRAPPTDGRKEGLTSRTIIKHVVETREGVLCADAVADGRFSGGSMHDSVLRLGHRSIICAPIICNDNVHGVLYLDSLSSEHTYSDEQLRLLVAIGRLTGMAIQNARLLEARVHTERLAAAGETVAYLSHHIRNLLQGLTGGADVVEMGIKNRDMEATKSGWTLVRRTLDRTYDLAMNMLTFSKHRRPRIEYALISDVVCEVVALVQNRADDKRVRVETDLQPIGPIPIDPNGIHQVIHNILVNAIEASPTGTGRVVVRTRWDSSTRHAVVSICDNGQGIPADFRASLFEAFESTKGLGGTGLGLAAARKIVDELGGEIKVDSQPDTGTSFHVRLAAPHAPLQGARKARPSRMTGVANS